MQKAGRILKKTAQLLYLFFHEKTRDTREVCGDPDHRCMGPVARTESVVDIEVCQTREVAGKTGIILLLPRVKPQVFQHNDVAVLHGGYCLLHRGPDSLPQRFDRYTHEF